MKRFLSELGTPRKELKAGKLRGVFFPKHRLFVLGIYGGTETFQGTDKLSMAVQPDAVKFLELLARSPEHASSSVLFEGDRLFNISFLEKVSELAIELKLLVLEVSEEGKHKRHLLRGDNQSEQFKASRKTKVRNVVEAFRKRATIVTNETPADGETALSWLLEELCGEVVACP